MLTPQNLETRFWQALESDMTVMLGLDGAEDGHTRPMTAQTEGHHGPIWFFASYDTALVRGLDENARAIATFSSKGHDLFATVQGRLSVDSNRATVDRLWNRFVAVWFAGGKNDPQLCLLRLDPENAEIWLTGSSVVAGVKMLLGMDPRQQYKDHVAKVALS